MKMPLDFPNYETYSDVDILCLKESEIHTECKKYLDENFQFENSISFLDSGARIHLDTFPFPGQRLDFKFDFINSFSVYQKCDVKDSLVRAMLNEKILDEETGCFKPTLHHEMIVRMLEYFEYVESRPSKKKHLDFVLKQLGISSQETREMFVEDWSSYVATDLDVPNFLKRMST